MKRKQMLLLACLLALPGCNKAMAPEQTSEVYSLRGKTGGKAYDPDWLDKKNVFKLKQDEVYYYPETPPQVFELTGFLDLKTESMECSTKEPIDFVCGVYIEDDPRIRNKSPRLDFDYWDKDSNQKVIQRKKLPSFKEEDYYQNNLFFQKEKTIYHLDNRTFDIQLDFAKLYKDIDKRVGAFELWISFPDVPRYYGSDTRIGRFQSVTWEYCFNEDGSRIEFSRKFGTFVK